MKKTQYNKKLRTIFSCLFILCLFFINTSCGLDTFEVIDAPYYLIRKPEITDENSYQTQSFESKQFEFFTNDSDNQNLSEIKFIGTDVYYKIYNSFDDLNRERSILNNNANSETLSVNLITSLTSSYGYKNLRASNFRGNVLIPASSNGSNQTVYIRLTDYNNSDYKACIKVDGNSINGSSINIPLRTVTDGKDKTFNFGKSGDNDKIPLSEDGDCLINTSYDSGIYYVNLYAVSVGIDTTFTPQYSNILNLGSISINSNSENN